MRLIWTELADLDLEKIEEYIGRENPLAGIDVVLEISCYCLMSNHYNVVNSVTPQSSHVARESGLPKCRGSSSVALARSSNSAFQVKVLLQII